MKNAGIDFLRVLFLHDTDPEKLADLIVLSQDMVAEMVNNTVILLWFNSTRSLCRKLTESSLQFIDREDIQDLIGLEKDLYRTVPGGSREEAGRGITKTENKLRSFRGESRKALMKRAA